MTLDEVKYLTLLDYSKAELRAMHKQGIKKMLVPYTDEEGNEREATFRIIELLNGQ